MGYGILCDDEESLNHRLKKLESAWLKDQIDEELLKEIKELAGELRDIVRILETMEDMAILRIDPNLNTDPFLDMFSKDLDEPTEPSDRMLRLALQWRSTFDRGASK